MQKLFFQNLLPICASLCVVVLVSGCAEDTKQAENDFQSALNSSELPWYDSESKQLTSSAAPNRPESSVADRNRIPPIPRKAGAQVKRTPAPAPAAAAAPNAMATAGTSIIYIAGGILACVVLALLIYGFLKLESGGEEEGKESKGRKIRDHIRHLPFEIEEQEGDFETFAEKSLREGNYNNAVIYLFADVLVAMSESGVVRLQRGKTNRQYLNEIWDHEELKDYFQTVMIAFEDAFFGKHQIEKDRAEECFARRAAFDAAIEKLRLSKFDYEQSGPAIPPPPSMSVETAG